MSTCLDSRKGRKLRKIGFWTSVEKKTSQFWSVALHPDPLGGGLAVLQLHEGGSLQNFSSNRKIELLVISGLL